ncbi:hypothetical protein [Planomonospora algeriensis]
MPPNSQGYLLLLALAVAEGLDLPADPTDPLWAHLLVEASRVAGHDRPELLFDGARVDASWRRPPNAGRWSAGTGGPSCAAWPRPATPPTCARWTATAWASR